MSVISARHIKALLDREDIENLLALGAPRDEYEPEAQMINSAIVKLQRERPEDVTTDQITNVIRDVWQEMFGPLETDQIKAREPSFRKVASDILPS
jgi:hypothetical protein